MSDLAMEFRATRRCGEMLLDAAEALSPALDRERELADSPVPEGFALPEALKDWGDQHASLLSNHQQRLRDLATGIIEAAEASERTERENVSAARSPR